MPISTPIEVLLEGNRLDQHGYLVDIVAKVWGNEIAWASFRQDCLCE